MSFNGSGTYSAPANSWNPPVSGTSINSTDWQAFLADLESALSTCIAKDGQSTTTAAIPFASGLNTNTISERTSASGVTVDSLLIKDGGATLKSSTSYIADDADATKKVTFDCSAISTGTTRTATWPDKDGTVAMTSDITASTAGDGIAVAGGAVSVDPTNATDTAISASDIISYADASASNAVKKDTVQGILDLVPTASDTAAGKIERAVQSEMETATAVDRAVVPGRMQYHPGVVKGWGKLTFAGSAIASYNILSVTDQATGAAIATWDDDFSSGDYVAVASPLATSVDRMVLVQDMLAGSCQFVCVSSSAATETGVTHMLVMAVGDQ